MNSESTNPYVGPRAFQEDESKLFFGRERESRELLSLVLSERLVLFYAQSGAGKSSLLNTTLIPNLKERGYKALPVGRVSGDTDIEVKNIHIFNLLRTLSPAEKGLNEIGKQPLTDFFAELNDKSEGNEEEVEKVFLIIDQFEELFSTHNEEWEKREDFFKQLTLALHDNSNLWVVLAMREDYIASLDPYTALLPGRLRARYYMQRLGREAALSAIRGPVEDLRPYAEGVAQKLVEDLCSIKVQKPDGTLDVQPGQYVEPVQLQVVCYSLWNNLSPEGKEITEKDLEDVGDVDQSLGKHYESRVNAVAKEKNIKERLIREWFEKKLITAGGIRNMVLQEPHKKIDGLDDDVIQALQSDLVRAEKRGGATFYELTHDRLVEPILENNRKWDIDHSSPFRLQAESWKATGDKIQFLIDVALTQADQWAKKNEAKLTNTDIEFLAACWANQKERDEKAELEDRRKKEEQEYEAQQLKLESAQKLADEQTRSAERAKRFTIIAVSLTVAAFIATSFAIVGLRSAQSNAKAADDARATSIVALADAKVQAAIARSHELSAQATNQLDGRPDLAILLSIEAYLTDDNSQAQNTLLTTLEESADIRKFLYFDQATDIQISPNGKTIAVLDEEGVTLLDLDGNKLGGPFTGMPSSISSTAFSPDGKTLASSSKDGSIMLWDVESKQLLGNVLTDHTDWVNTVSFSPNGKLLLSASDDQTVVLWDVSNTGNPKIIGEPIQTGDGVNDAVLSPRDNILASMDSSGVITLWDLSKETPQIVNKLDSESGNTTLDMEFSPDGKILASGDFSGNIFLWNMLEPRKSTIMAEVYLDQQEIRCLAFSPNGKILAAGTSDGSIILWNVSNPKNPQKIGEPLKEHRDVVNSINFSPDGNTFASGSSDGKVILWDVTTRKAITELLNESFDSIGILSQVNNVEFNPSGNLLSSGIQNGSIILWDVSKREMPQKIEKSLQGHASKPYRMEFSRGGSFLTIFSLVPDLYNDAEYSTIVNAINYTNLGTAQVEFEDPLGKFIIYQSYDLVRERNQIQIYNASTRKVLGNPISGEFLYFNSANEIIVYKTINEFGVEWMNFWDLNAEKELDEHLEGQFLALSPDGEILVYSDNNRFINLLSMKTGDEIGKPFEGEFIGVDPNSKNLLYSTIDEKDQFIIVIRDILNGNIIGKPVIGTYLALTFDGRTLLYQTFDSKGNTLYSLLDTTTTSSVSITDYITPNNYYPTFSPDGSVLSYQTYNNNVQSYYFAFWDVAANQKIGNSTSGDNIVGTHQQGNILIFQIMDVNEQKIIVMDTAKHKQIGETIRGVFKTTLEDGRFVIYQDESGLKQLDTTSGKTISIAIKGELLGASPDGNVLYVRNGSALEIRDANRALTPGVNVTYGEYQGNLSTVALSPDGKTLALFNTEDIIFQDVGRGVEVGKPFNYHSGGITFPGAYATFSPDGSILAIENFQSYTVTLWDMNTQQQIGNELSGGAAAFSPNGKILAIGNNSTYTVTLWNVNTQRQFRRDIPGTSAVFSPDGRIMAVGDYSTYTVTLWDMNTQLRFGRDIPGTSAVFSPDGKILAVGNNSTYRITLWDVNTQLQIGRDIPGTSAVFSPDGKTLAVGDYSIYTVALWDVNTQLQIGRDIPGTSAVFSPDGKTLAVGDYSTYTVTLWDVNTLTEIKKNIPGTSGVFSSDGNILAVGDYGTNTVTIWDVGIQNKTVNVSRKLAAKGRVTTLKFSPDGRILASIGDDGIILSNVATQEKISGPFSGNNVTFSPDSTIIAISNENNTTSLWDVTTGALVTESILGSDPVFSPDDLIIATKNNENITITLWKLNTYEALRTDPIPGNDILFSPDGKIAAILNWTHIGTNQNGQSGDGTPTATAEPIRQIGITILAVTSTSITSIKDIPLSCLECGNFFAAFSQDGEMLAYNDGGEIYLWDIANQKMMGSPITVLNGVTKLAFIQNGQFLVSEDFSSLTTIWDLSSLAPFGKPFPGSLQLDVSNSNSDEYLIWNNGSWSLWKFSSEDWITQLCQKVARNLTREEWTKYLPSEEIYRPTCSEWPLQPESITTPSP